MPLDPDERFCAMARGRLVRYVRRLYPRYSRETAEDVAQETFLRYLRFRRGHDAPNPMALLYTLARWSAATEFRRQFGKTPQESIESGGPDGRCIDPPGLPARLTNEHHALMVLRMLEWLHAHRPDDVPIFLLRLEELTYAEIGARLGLTETAVRQRISRSYREIRGHKAALGMDDLLEAWLSGGELT